MSETLWWNYMRAVVANSREVVQWIDALVNLSRILEEVLKPLLEGSRIVCDIAHESRSEVVWLL